MKKRDEIGLDAIILSAYFALAPMHQTLLVAGGTVVKYLAFLTMCACIWQGYKNNRRFFIIWDLIWPVGLMLGWFGLTYIWADSRSNALSALISLGSYCAMMLIVGSRQWNKTEKRLFLFVLILSCTYYAVQLIGSVATSKRATLSLAVEGEEESREADQNVVACNIGFGAVIAFYTFLIKKNCSIKWLALASMSIIMLGIVSTGSRGGLIAVCAAFAYLIYKKSIIDIRMRNRIVFIIGGALLAYWLIFDLNILNNDSLVSRYKNTDVSAANGRSEIWMQYFNTLLSRPAGLLCGYGCGCETIAHASYMGRSWLRDSHNDYISILCQGGIPGFLLIAGFVRHVWLMSRKKGGCLGAASIILALIGSLDISFLKTYGWWNAMLIAYLCIDDALSPAPLPLQRCENQLI